MLQHKPVPILKSDITFLKKKRREKCGFFNGRYIWRVLEIQAKLGKMLMIFVISIFELTKTVRSDGEVRGVYYDRFAC